MFANHYSVLFLKKKYNLTTVSNSYEQIVHMLNRLLKCIKGVFQTLAAPFVAIEGFYVQHLQESLSVVFLNLLSKLNQVLRAIY